MMVTETLAEQHQLTPPRLFPRSPEAASRDCASTMLRHRIPDPACCRNGFKASRLERQKSTPNLHAALENVVSGKLSRLQLCRSVKASHASRSRLLVDNKVQVRGPAITWRSSGSLHALHLACSCGGSPSPCSPYPITRTVPCHLLTTPSTPPTTLLTVVVAIRPILLRNAPNKRSWLPLAESNQRTSRYRTTTLSTPVPRTLPTSLPQLYSCSSRLL
ncbi:hypothetical protein BKA80DRAFT_74226 [Phyllosticta citrichinensis]